MAHQWQRAFGESCLLLGIMLLAAQLGLHLLCQVVIIGWLVLSGG